ncbi:hypothetical protein [Methanoregula sp.]|jgi:hypothetical protein|uniref:hypothetical protein n=1 Tax=Methanoregula sp. TaxID=2052170 RepID=UPI003C132BD7
MKKITGLTIIIVCGLILAMCLAGCMQKMPDPETGVNNWVSAANNHDYSRVYDLAPQEIRIQINRQDFIAAQNGNPFLAPGNSIRNYQVVNRTLSGDNAELTVAVDLYSPGSANASSGNVLIFLKFLEVFEDGEWKVWTTKP